MGDKIQATKQAIHGTLGVLPIGSKAAGADNPNLLKNLGQEVEGQAGSRWRLVQLDYATGLSTAGAAADGPGAKIFNYTGEVTDGYKVEPCNAATDRPCGVSHPDQVTLVHGDVFWVQIEGICTLTNSDDGTDTTAGDFVGGDNDADRGKVLSVTTNFAYGVAPFRALQTQAAVDGTFLAMIMHKLVG